MRCGLLLSVCVLVSAICLAEQPLAKDGPAPGRKAASGGLDPRTLPGLICFWDFQESAGRARQSRGPHPYLLEERNGPIERVDGGLWGPFAARIRWGQWMRIPRADCPALDIHGPNAQYTILAWLQRIGDKPWAFVAGMWDEAQAERQYALFVSGSLKTSWKTKKRTKVSHHAHAYISAEGGGTPGDRICLSYATGATVLEQGRWYFLAATYDQSAMRVYVDGRFDALEQHNPFPYPNKPIFDGGREGADFTVAQRNVPGWDRYPDGTVHRPVGFDGVLGGLAVFNRALTAEEISAIQAFSSARECRCDDDGRYGGCGDTCCRSQEPIPYGDRSAVPLDSRN